uniref:Agrin n=1 Tax=Lygus hesperus TaxID=30085 RepID=A0A0A9WHK1_LYGHE
MYHAAFTKLRGGQVAAEEDPAGEFVSEIWWEFLYSDRKKCVGLSIEHTQLLDTWVRVLLRSVGDRSCQELQVFETAERWLNEMPRQKNLVGLSLQLLESFRISINSTQYRELCVKILLLQLECLLLKPQHCEWWNKYNSTVRDVP